MSTGFDIIAWARSKLGDPYLYGANGPNAFDCSSLTQNAYAHGAGVNIPRTSSEQWAFLKNAGRVSQDKANLYATPGDLIFSQWPGDDATPGHVGIYIGGHQLIEAPKPGGAVQVADIDQTYFDHIYGVGHAPGVDIPQGTSADLLTPGTTHSVPSGPGGFTATGTATASPGQSIGPLDFLNQAVFGIPINPLDPVGGMGGLLSSLTAPIASIGKVFYTLTLPSTWARVGAGLLGTLLLAFGLWHLGKDLATHD